MYAIDDDAAYQNAQAARDAEADFRAESADWTDEEWFAYEEERRAEWAWAMGPVVSAGDPDGMRDDLIAERDAWDQAIPLSEFDGVPF